MTFILIDKRSDVPFYRQIYEQLRVQILSGELAAGHQLTSVRDQAAALGVNPMTVSKAYTLLEQEELLERRKGIGLFVSTSQSEVESTSKRQLLEQGFKPVVIRAMQLGYSLEPILTLVKDIYTHLSGSKDRG